MRPRWATGAREGLSASGPAGVVEPAVGPPEPIERCASCGPLLTDLRVFSPQGGPRRRQAEPQYRPGLLPHEPGLRGQGRSFGKRPCGNLPHPCFGFEVALGLQFAPDASGTKGWGMKKVVSIQALRGLAAALVVVAHILEHPLTHAGDQLLLVGRFGVEIFFVISGFIISSTLGNSPFNPVRFAFRRVMRIAPLYWVCTGVTFALTAFAPQILKSTRGSVEYLFKSLVFIPAPVRPGSLDWRPLLKLGWTLNYEMFFYSAIALLFWCATARLRAVILVTVLTVLMAITLLHPTPGTLFGYYTNLSLIPFVLGVILAEVWRSTSLVRRSVFVAAGVAAALLTATLFSSVGFEAAKQQLGPHLIMSTAALSIVVSGISFENYMSGRAARLFSWAGDISFSLYLTHMFLVAPFWGFLSHLHLRTGAFSIALLCALEIALFITCLLVAHLGYVLLERPLNRWAYRLSTQTPSASSRAGPPKKASTAA